MAWDESRGIALGPFVGRGAPLSRAICYVLAIKQPMTTRQIGKNVRAIPYFKDTRYSTVNKKVRELEKQGCLKKTQTKERVGGLTNYYELTPQAILKKILDSNSAEELFGNKSDEEALILAANLIKNQQDKPKKSNKTYFKIV